MTDFIDFVIKYWVTFLFGLITAWFMKAYTRRIDKRQEALEAEQKKAEIEQKAIANGVMALLRDRIIQSCNHYREKGYCPIYARDNIDSLFKEYAALGGNGTVKDLVNETKELPWEKEK